MEEKPNYTHQEVQRMLESHGNYTYWKGRLDNIILEKKENLNSCVEDCEENLPQSLVDKLNIKKIE